MDTSKVRLFDPAVINEVHMSRYHQQLDKVLRFGQLVLGDEVKIFEETFKEKHRLKNGIGVGNGLDALKFILLGLIHAGKLQVGDKVILPAFTFKATALAVLQSGLTPVFVDIDLKTLNIDFNDLESKLDDSIKAIIVVHLFGLPVDIKHLKSAVGERIIIEDAAQAHGVDRVGQSGYAAFSFYPTKTLGALGDAGMILTKDEAVAKYVRSASNYGTDSFPGQNSRLDEVQAAFLNIKLAKLDEINKIRRTYAALYHEKLQGLDQIKLPPLTDERGWYQFVIQSETRDRLQFHLDKKGIETKVHYGKPCYETDYFNAVSLPNSEKATRTVLSLPVHEGLSTEDITYVCDCIQEFFEQR